MRGRLEELADRYLDQLEREANESPGGVDLIKHFARPFPLAVICELLGLPEEDRPKFTHFADRLTKASSIVGIMRALPGIWRLLRYFKQQFKRGEVCLASLASANRDPAEFDEPERFDIHRQPNHHVSFGTGIHVCLGLKLARAEAAIAFEKLFTRFPDLELSVARTDLQWTGRLGIRAFTALPVRLRQHTASGSLSRPLCAAKTA